MKYKRYLKASITVEATFVTTWLLFFFLVVLFLAFYFYDTFYLYASAQKNANEIARELSELQKEGKIDWDAWEGQSLYHKQTQDFARIKEEVNVRVKNKAGKAMIFRRDIYTDVALEGEYVTVTYLLEYRFPLTGLIKRIIGKWTLPVYIQARAKCVRQEDILRLLQSIFHVQ